MHTLFQVTKEQFSEDLNTTTAAYNGNPGSSPDLQVAVADPVGGVTLLGASYVTADVTLTYYTMLYDRNQLLPS